MIKKINEFLSNPIFNNFEAVRLQWHLFGDDDVISRDMSIPVNKFFKNRILYNNLCKQCKAIVRGGINNLNVVSSHYSLVDNRLFNACMPDGTKTQDKRDNTVKYNEVAWLNHYMTKTLSEFIDQKLNRTDCQFIDRKLDLNYFWKINKRTPEKEEYLNKIFSGE